MLLSLLHLVQAACGAGLGGLNVGAEYAGSWVVPSLPGCQPWRDNAVGIRGPSARLLMAAFARMWRYVNGGGKIRNFLADRGKLDRLVSVEQLAAGDWDQVRPDLMRAIPQEFRMQRITDGLRRNEAGEHLATPVG